MIDSLARVNFFRTEIQKIDVEEYGEGGYVEIEVWMELIFSDLV